ncbi:PepSY domain-containing protein [Sphingomonas sp. MMS24-J13]|uniref:PepSY domain-containing protein n=1 Tax=Sphingomonas sp. MMS24-J13 TaxID=3238686 RepID=UPI00384BEA64
MRTLVWFHRWLGIATCVIFALWFASGAVLLLVPFPSLAKSDAQKLGQLVDVAAVRIAPDRALALTGGSGLRLRQRAGVPVYIAGGTNGFVTIDARTGRRLSLLSPAGAAAMLADRAGGPITSVEGPITYDQWVVHDGFDALRPFYRVSIGDGRGTRIYVSAQTGEIVQRTTTRERAWNWVGAVLHWVYFTPLRASFSAWDRTVWILSFVAMLVAGAGMIVGIVRTVAVRRARRPGLTYFKPQWMRWHHLTGLFVGIFVMTWILSGWLSMDHGRLFSRGRATPAELANYAGLTDQGMTAATPLAALQRLPASHEIRLTAAAGTPLLSVVGRDGLSRLWTNAGAPLTSQQAASLYAVAVQRAWPRPAMPVATPVAPDDLYVLAEGMPASAVRFEGGPDQPDIYIDRADGQILTVMSTSRAAYAWIYYGLHSFNFPGLARHQIVRDAIVLALMLAGFLFSVTGVVLGWQRLRKTIAPRIPKEVLR